MFGTMVSYRGGNVKSSGVRLRRRIAEPPPPRRAALQRPLPGCIMKSTGIVCNSYHGRGGTHGDWKAPGHHRFSGDRENNRSSTARKGISRAKSVHMHTDDFYHYLSKGAVAPHLPESNEQNRVVIEAFLAAAKRFARGGMMWWWTGSWARGFWNRGSVSPRRGMKSTTCPAGGPGGDFKAGAGPHKIGPGDECPAGGDHVGAVPSLGSYERHVVDTTALHPGHGLCDPGKIADRSALLG